MAQKKEHLRICTLGIFADADLKEAAHFLCSVFLATYQFKKQLACGVFQDCHVVASSITIMSCIAHVLPVVNKVKRVCLPFPPFSLSTT